MGEPVFEAVNVTKRYRRALALDQVSMRVEQGQIYGFVGENGAGKSTMLRLLAGLAEPTGGELRLFGQSGRALMAQRRRTGCIIDHPALYPDMTARENLEVQCLQRGIRERACIGETLELVGLTGTGRKRAGEFSLGMRQRLALAAALLGSPDLLVLDEPVNGLDPTGILELRRLLARLNRERGVTILISSHILAELHQLATCYGFLHRGRLLQQLTAAELDARCERHLYLQVDSPARAAALLGQALPAVRCENGPDGGLLLYGAVPEQAAAVLVGGGIALRQLTPQGDDLETYYTKLIGGAAAC